MYWAKLHKSRVDLSDLHLSTHKANKIAIKSQLWAHMLIKYSVDSIVTKYISKSERLVLCKKNQSMVPRNTWLESLETTNQLK